MRERPANLADETLRARLASDFQLPVTELTFLPLGHDAEAWVYRADVRDGAPLFVKVRLSVLNAASLMVPHHLVGAGVANVVAPLPNAAGALWSSVSGYAVIVYPFVSTTTGMARGMTDAQWIAYGATLRQVHDTRLTAEMEDVMRHETFEPAGSDVIGAIDEHIEGSRCASATQRRVAALWIERRATIERVRDRAMELGTALAAANLPCVLCHADIHTNNVLVADDGRIWIADWDETAVAPRERDLMFVVGGIHKDFVSPRQTRLFFDGYGDVHLDQHALAYYRYAWAVADISAYAHQVFMRDDLGQMSTTEAADRFVSLFDARSIVSIAFESELEREGGE